MSHFGESPVQLTPQSVVKPMSVSLAEGHRPVNAGSGLDSREVSLEAPAGTPAPLAEAYEGIAQTLFDASEMRRSPPTIRQMFRKEARSLSSAWKANRERYTPVELLLLAEGEGGCGAHQDALNTICRINDACGHVMLGIIPFDEVTEHLQAVSVFDVAEQLKAMRRELSRAALRFQGPTRDMHILDKLPTEVSTGLEDLALPYTAQGGITSGSGPTASFVEPNQTLTRSPSSEAEIALPATDTDTQEHTVAQGGPGARKTLKQPSNDAFTAYRAGLATGKNQTELAQLLTNEWRRTVYQGNVSRWLDQVKSWLEAGNVLPDLSPPAYKKPLAMDPDRIDLGERQDHRSERQRERRNSDAGD